MYCDMAKMISHTEWILPNWRKIVLLMIFHECVTVTNVWMFVDFAPKKGIQLNVYASICWCWMKPCAGKMFDLVNCLGWYLFRCEYTFTEWILRFIWSMQKMKWNGNGNQFHILDRATWILSNTNRLLKHRWTFLFN